MIVQKLIKYIDGELRKIPLGFVLYLIGIAAFFFLLDLLLGTTE